MVIVKISELLQYGSGGNMKKNGLILITMISAMILGGCGISARESNEEGIKLYGQGNYTDALVKFNQAVSQNGKVPIYYVNRGMANVMAGNTDTGIEDFNRALEMDEECTQAYRGLGIVYMQQEKYDMAIEAFNQALSYTKEIINQVDYDILEHRAEAEVLSGDYNNAVETYTSLIGFGVHSGENYMRRGLLYARNQAASEDKNDMYFLQYALEDFDLALESEPQNYELYLNIYQCMRSYGYKDIAEEYLQKALNLPEETTEDMRAKGKVFFYLGRYQEALPLFLDAIDNKDVESCYFTAKCCEQIEDYDAAMKIYETIMAKEENQTAAGYNQMAECLVLQGNYKDAEIYMRQAEALDSDGSLRSHILWNKTIMYEKMEDFSSAYYTLEEYITRYGSSYEVEREMAYIKQRL